MAMRGKSKQAFHDDHPRDDAGNWQLHFLTAMAVGILAVAIALMLRLG